VAKRRSRFGGYGHRAWAAWHCLPGSDKFGRPVADREITRRSPLLNQGEFLKLVHEEYSEPSWRVVYAAALELGVSMQWLMLGEGEGPKRPAEIKIPDWPGPRPSAKKGAGAPEAHEQVTRLPASVPTKRSQRPKRRTLAEDKRRPR